MTEKEQDKGKQPEPPKEDPIEALRNELRAEVQAIKTDYDNKLAEKDSKIAEQAKQIEGLQREALRHAILSPTSPPKEKTEEEIYAEKLKARCDATRKYMLRQFGKSSTE